MLYVAIWYVSIRPVVMRVKEELQEVFFLQLCNGWTCRVVRVLQHIPNLRIQLVQNAPDDGPVRPETCRVNIRDE